MKCVLIAILTIFLVNQIGAKSINFEETPIKNVAIIGAGTSGLVSAKYSLAQGYDVTIFEQNPQLGGIWWYTDETGVNQYGIEIHSPMYQKLRFVMWNEVCKKYCNFLLKILILLK